MLGGLAARPPARIRRGETPNFAQPDEAPAHRVYTELFQTQRLSGATFEKAVATLGETGLVEVIAIIGYSTLIGNTLDVFQVPIPDGEAPPFDE